MRAFEFLQSSSIIRGGSLRAGETYLKNMSDRAEFLVYGRRLHNVLRSAIRNGGDGSRHWKDNPELCAHYLCAVYLIGSLAFLEGKYDKESWQRPGSQWDNFDAFIAGSTAFHKLGINEAAVDALVCIRNAVAHNNNDLAKNNDSASLSKVTNADIGGVTIDGSMVRLSSNETADFMAFVRMSLVAVAQYHGDG